ncbi:MAG: hypothetical protein FJ138_14290 [Deltaproteobacteria bacterium]|nr:hypothetical protein [Deltaproteobacteria bacterium]
MARRAPNPLRFSGEALLWALRGAGVEVGDGVEVSRGALPPEGERRLLHTVTSAPLRDLLRDVNVYSNNFMAEQTLLTLGLERGGFGGWEEGLAAARAHLRGALGLRGFKYSNGSGLFGETALSARHITDLLIQMHARSGGRFVELLPRSAAEGTLRARLRRLPRGAARAKTGTLDAVSTLCGHLTPRAGAPLVFCVLMSWREGDAAAARRAQDAALERAWRLTR